MKTEQEQIDEIIKIFTDNREVCHHMRCVECKYHGDKECMYSSYAYSLYQAGYGDVSEYKAEIEYRKKQYDNQIAENTRLYIEYDKAFERLKAQQREIERLRTTLGQCNTELNSALESLKSQCREIGKLRAKVKQAQIDVLNKLKDSYGLYYLSAFGVKERMLADILNPMIEEVENGEDKG